MIGEPWMPYRDAMMGRPWTVNCQVNPISSMTVTGIPLAGPYRSGMMDYRESERHKDWLKQQDAAFNSPSGLNSHREMYFGEPVATPKAIAHLKTSYEIAEDARLGYNLNNESLSYQERVYAENEAFRKSMDEKRSRENEQMVQVMHNYRIRDEEFCKDISDRIRKNQEEMGKYIFNPSWVPTTDHSLDNPLFVNQDKKGKHFGNGFGIQPINVVNDILPSGGMHDSFKVNSSGDIFGGHTTIELKVD